MKHIVFVKTCTVHLEVSGALRCDHARIGAATMSHITMSDAFAMTALTVREQDERVGSSPPGSCSVSNRERRRNHEHAGQAQSEDARKARARA